MKILYFNVIEQNSGWGAEYFLNKAFNKIGVETITIDYRKNRYQLTKRLKEIKGDFDAVLLQRGEEFPLEILKAINRPKFFWATELFSRRRDQDRMFSSGLFEHIFVLDDFGREQIIKNGWTKENKISTMVGAFDSGTHNKKEGIKKDIDISFVGSILPRRRKILDRLKKKFNIQEFRAWGKNMSEIFNRSKITLNIHAEDYLDAETRIFEALGSGAFLISEKTTKQNPFKNGVEMIEVESIDEMEKKIEYYLKHNEEREKIADAGHKEAMENHTYIARAKQILSVICRSCHSDLAEESLLSPRHCVQNIPLRVSGSSCHCEGFLARGNPFPALDYQKLSEYKNKEFYLFILKGLPHLIKMKLSKIKKAILKK